jgi:hypothetical protein
MTKSKMQLFLIICNFMNIVLNLIMSFVADIDVTRNVLSMVTVMLSAFILGMFVDREY